jgi:hypothetical protein
MATLKENKTKNKQKKPSPFKRGFKTLAEKHGEDFRKLLSIQIHEPLSPHELAKYLQLEILTLYQIPGANPEFIDALLNTEKSDQWSGFIICLNGENLIVYNSSHSPARIASTIMHECAHAILKHPMAPINLNAEVPRNEYPKEQEAEAEWLSGCLLLPKAALLKHHIYKKQTVEQIADYFGVSTEMVNYRLRVSGVLTIKSRLRN